MLSLANYLKRPDAERIFLAEIYASGATHFMADAPYITESGDVHPSQPFAPIIAVGGIPRLTRRLDDLWGGRTVQSWGPLRLADRWCNGVDLAAAAIRGAQVKIEMVGPRHIVDYADEAELLVGIAGPKSGNAEGELTIILEDKQSLFDATVLPPNRYDAASEAPGFPAANDGKAKPLCLGTCRNVNPVLIDAANLVYQVNDGPVNAISQIYDNGVAVGSTTNLPAGQFTLLAAPAGTVTADVQGMKDGAAFLSSTADIIDWLARTYGGLTAPDIDISGLPADAVGMYITGETTLAEVISRFMRGLLGWWGFSRAGTFKARLINAPAGGGVSYGETEQLSDVPWDEDQEIVWAVPLIYQRNWTPLEPAAAVALSQAEWLRGEGMLDRYADASVLSSWPSAIEAVRLETLFDTLTPANTVATRAVALFGTPRRTARLDVPMPATPHEIAGEVSIAGTDGILDGDYIVLAATDVLDGEIPVAELEVWG